MKRRRRRRTSAAPPPMSGSPGAAAPPALTPVMGRLPEESPPVPATLPAPAELERVGVVVGVFCAGELVVACSVGVVAGRVVEPAGAGQVWVSTNLSASPVIVAVAAV